MFKEIDISNLSNFFTEKYDLFICFNSFEERCFSIASHIPKDKFSKALILTNEIQFENAAKNLQKLTEIFENKATVAYLDLSLPVDVADSIIEHLNKINSIHKISSVFIDITTFTHESLLILLAIIKEKFKLIKIICGYNNAKEYSTDKKTVETKWLSRGIGEVRSILGYSGKQKPSKENLLMVIVGYEYERAARIIDIISPDHLAIGYNVEDTATTEKNRSANEGYAKLLKKMAAYFEQTTDFVVPSNNPYKAYQAICEELDYISN